MTTLINKELLHKNISPCSYYIGTDSYDGIIHSYCLVRKMKNSTEVLLAKSMRDKKEFDKEVENLEKYFNAVKI